MINIVNETSIKWWQPPFGYPSESSLVVVTSLRWLNKVLAVCEYLAVIYQIMARERLQLTSWNLASEKYTDERFWLTGKIWHFFSLHGNMNDWIQP